MLREEEEEEEEECVFLLGRETYVVNNKLVWSHENEIRTIIVFHVKTCRLL